MVIFLNMHVPESWKYCKDIDNCRSKIQRVFPEFQTFMSLLLSLIFMENFNIIVIFVDVFAVN